MAFKFVTWKLFYCLKVLDFVFIRLNFLFGERDLNIEDQKMKQNKLFPNKTRGFYILNNFIKFFVFNFYRESLNKKVPPSNRFLNQKKKLCYKTFCKSMRLQTTITLPLHFLWAQWL